MKMFYAIRKHLVVLRHDSDTVEGQRFRRRNILIQKVSDLSVMEISGYISSTRGLQT